MSFSVVTTIALNTMTTLPYLFDCFTYITLPSPCTHFPTCLADSHTQLLPSPCPHFPTGLAASHTQLCLPHAHTSPTCLKQSKAPSACVESTHKGVNQHPVQMAASHTQLNPPCYLAASCTPLCPPRSFGCFTYTTLP